MTCGGTCCCVALQGSEVCECVSDYDYDYGKMEMNQSDKNNNEKERWGLLSFIYSFPNC
jgi:hypothetical protein